LDSGPLPARSYPAIAVRWADAPAPELVEHLLAAIDEARPTAVEEQPSGVRVFFSTTEDRDRAQALATRAAPAADVVALSVSDEAWAERSQASLLAVRVGRVVVTPPWRIAEDSGSRSDDDIVITIVPSMGFGTGHHASTRLCLALLQKQRIGDVAGLDVGTGSGVLAVAMSRLGARLVTAIDSDPDAIVSARESVALNGVTESVTVECRDLAAIAPSPDGTFGIVTANLTGAPLQRFAATLAAAVTPGGVLIVSGFQEDDEAAVRDAFVRAGLSAADRALEDGWVALQLVPNPA
jgi:ribosomal protein L11 methyltransferase